ncbi:MAG: porin family protein [Bacteroidota bacterium]|nr:porin family protein [Bacteroidota bacterium]
MKKLCFLSVLTAFTLFCTAQPQFGIFAGGQATTAKYTIQDIKQPNQYKYGFQVGLGLKVPFDPPLFFSPAIFYSMKGYKVQFNQPAYPPDTLAVDNNTTIHTVEMAFLLQLDLGKRPDHFFIKAGPSLDFQLFGKEKYNLKAGGLVDRKMIFGFTDYGHFSASLLMQLGFETNSGFMIFGQYSLGLASINNADYGPQIHHRIYGISFGKYLNHKKTAIDTRKKE